MPAGPPTTDQRRMRDKQGRIQWMRGDHSFTLKEQGGSRNRIRVSNVQTPCHPDAAAPDSNHHAAHGKVKLNGDRQASVTLYARPDFGAPISGMSVSSEVLDKVDCQSCGSLA